MTRMARIVVPDVPHHITQRGVRRMEVFMQESDYADYLNIIKESAAKAKTKIVAYCLMPNHVHFIMIPSTEDGLRATFGEAHRQYTRMINFREKCRGHLWQERFHSFPMEGAYILHCARYVEMNPVKAKMVKHPADWKWSSAKGHLGLGEDSLIDPSYMLGICPDWEGLLNSAVEEDTLKKLELHSQTGRPLGTDEWLEKLEKDTGRRLKALPAGRPKDEK